MSHHQKLVVSTQVVHLQAEIPCYKEASHSSYQNLCSPHSMIELCILQRRTQLAMMNIMAAKLDKIPAHLHVLKLF